MLADAAAAGTATRAAIDGDDCVCGTTQDDPRAMNPDDDDAPSDDV